MLLRLRGFAAVGRAATFALARVFALATVVASLAAALSLTVRCSRRRRELLPIR